MKYGIDDGVKEGMYDGFDDIDGLYAGIFHGFIEIDGFVDRMRDGIDDGIKIWKG